MATLSHVKSRRMYSWWWDSHISPKNSKWLQDNLTDMDSKVKAMIKLIEEDADSFAKRAEMYYKKRPELMKFVEEFYRAYRALAERYDHATVVIRQAHHTMSEAFPNQESSVLVDDTPVKSGSGDDPETPELSTPPRALVEADDPETTEMSTPPRALVEADDLQSKGFELSSSPFDDVPRNGEHTEVPDIVARIKESNPSNNFESSDYPKLRVRKCLSFQGEDGKQQCLRSDEDQRLQVRAMGGADQEGEPEEILNLKKAIAEVEAEKEAGLLHYQQTLKKLSKLESEISHAQQDSQKLSERASTAEAEVWTLKEALAKVEVEKDSNLLKYQQSLDKISSLEKIVSQAEASTCELNQRASIAESEAQSLRDELEKVTSEKDSALDQYVLSLEKISNLENRLEFAEEAARMLFERAEKAENQIEALKQEISKLSEEKEVADVRYKKCIDTISSLENKLSSACEELLQLRSEVDDGVAKLKGAEEQCLLLERSNQSLQAELESLMLKIDAQDQELTEKQKELGRLWTCIQEEHFRFVEAETAFLTLQQLHAKTQEEIQALALDLQKRVQILKDMEAHNKKMQDEVLKLKEENVTLNELNVSSATSIKSMQDEISLLKETNRNLQEEVELRLDERNALQRELYCLKEEQNNLNNNHLSILEQVHAIGLSPECLKSSVKKLQDENMNLKQSCERERIEKEALLQKLEIFGRLLEKNSVLENSLSDLSAKLEAAKGMIRALEESCQSLLQEKSNLLDEKTYLGSQLQVANENLGKLSENNTILEKSLSDAHDELYMLQEKLKSLEDSCLQLANQKAGLACENDMLGKQLQSTRLILEEMERQSAELEGRYVIAEKEKASALSRMEQLQVALDEEKQEHAHFAEVNETRLAAIESMMHLLQEEYQARKREFEVELDRALHSEIEIFVLKRCALDLEKTNLAILMKYQNLMEASTLSENVISELQKENADQQKELKSLSHQASTLRKGMLQLLKPLDIGERDACQENDDQDVVHLHSILHKIEDTKRSFGITEEENQKLVLEKTVLITLLEQLILEYEHLEKEKISIAQELKIQSECSSMVKGEALRFQEMNEELKLKLRERDYRVEALVKEVDNLQRNLMDVQGSLHELERENLKIVEEKRFLTEESLLMKDNNNILEEDNHIIMLEMLSLGCLSLILENYVDDRTIELKELNEYLGELHGENGAIREKLDSTRNKLGEVEVENISLREKLQKAKDELQNTTAIREKLRNDILLTRDLLHEKQANAKIQEVLQNELQKQINEVEIWETEAAVILSQLQTSSVFQVIYEQKVHELMEACNRLEHENIVKDADIKLRSEIISNLTSENESLNVQLAAYDPAITALRECITSLESKTLHRKLQKPMSEEFQGDEMTNDDGLMVADASSASHDLLNRVKAIEKTVVEMEEQLVLHENLDVHSQLKAALSQIEELKYENSLYSRKLRPESEIFEGENALMTKDIMLDQASESSSYAVSRREQFELWEIADQDDSIGLTVGSLKKMVTPSPEKNTDLGQVKSLKKKKLDFPASDALLEKDLSVDKLEISQRSMGSVREGNGQKVLQRLNSDIQKLTNLHITVQDLKMKVENTEKSRKVKAIDEFDTLKQQLEEAEATILKLLNLNGKLMKRIEDNSADMKSSMDSEDFETVRRRRTSEHARRVSEKIGRLQLEVQKIQFILLKLDGEKESKGKTGVSESRRRVLLKDYLYGGRRISKSKRKKPPFCGCVQSPAQGD